MLLGCIADDLTGATDLAGGLVRQGLRVTLTVGVPDDPFGPSIDAAVVALKSRSIEPAAATTLALGALDRLLAGGAERIYFKYASTFDSTARGNIGPVTDALADALGAAIVVACPAFPENGRAVIGGELLVHGVPLAETSMRNHPLNPMTDSSVGRLLQAQTARAVELVDATTVAGGGAAIRGRLDGLAATGARHAVVDAATDADLDAIASAVADDPLVTGASALAAAIARRLRPSGRRDAGRLPGGADGHAAVVSGSASAATRAQVAALAETHPMFEVSPDSALDEPDLVARAIDWAATRLTRGPLLVAAAEPSPDARAGAGAAIERTLAEIAAGLVEAGVRRLVVAGGETSGAVIERLGIRVLDVGEEIAPGVPVVAAAEPVQLRLALKSGNFGSDDFFSIALEALGSGTLAARGPASPPERGEGS